MRRTWGYLPLLALLLFCIPFASGQSAVDVNIGLGTANDSANKGGIDNTTGASCTPGSGSTTCQSLPSLSGVFLGFGGDIMFRKQFGFGAEANIQPAKSNYGPLQYRETFYDVNGIYQPISQKRYLVQLQGGIGGAKTGFSITQSSCVGSVACSTQSSPVGNASHFQVHFGAGVSIFVTEHIFIRPQFDLRYVPGLNQVFGSNLVPAGTIWVGYNSGHNQ